MNFAELYKDNKEAVTRALTTMWCYDGSSPDQADYLRQMKHLVEELFAPANAVPLVQCMNSYIPVKEAEAQIARDLVAPLWTAPYLPFQHQYECWEALLEGYVKDADGNKYPKSICVTTGTGSGKTECFMMPLVKDLIKPSDEDSESLCPKAPGGGVKAVFLYPLNALMDDQKDRLEELIKKTGVDIWYAVYNGNLPEDEPDDSDDSDWADKVRKKIRSIRGMDEDGNVKFPHALYTRKMVRQTPPDILLTNPTMLEYILLRETDRNLIATGDLRWVVIDETHTYTGAAAAELAMTLRRVLIAFGKEAREIRFATSSATFGNAKTEEEKAKAKADLQKFISDLTGTTVAQVQVVGGERTGIISYPHNKDRIYWERICANDFSTLDEIFPGEGTVEEKLAKLDALCDREEIRYKEAGEKIPAMKAKVHYFYRVPNKGIFADLTKCEGKAFKLEDKAGEFNSDHNRIPLLELGRCSNCGEFIAVGRMSADNRVYALRQTDKDIFETELYEDDEDTDAKMTFFALSDTPVKMGDNNRALILEGDALRPALPGEIRDGQLHIVANEKHECPCCREKLAKKTEEPGEDGGVDDNRLRKFHVSSEFISRLIAPSTLEQLQKGDVSEVAERRKTTPDKIIMLHDGQQYISFIDSRQGAATGSLEQNIEQERRWVIKTIYEALRSKALDGKTEIEKLEAELSTLERDTDEYDELEMKLRKLRRQQSKADYSMTWREVFNLLRDHPYAERFAYAFAKHSGKDNEIDNNGDVTPEYLRKYILSIMVEYLGHRSLIDVTPENLGLFHPIYKNLTKVTQLPKAVDDFNSLLDDESHKIRLDDWKNLLSVTIDHTVRNNQSVYLNMEDFQEIDIFATNRFSTRKPSRKPFNPPVMKHGEVARNRAALYLTDLLRKEKGGEIAAIQYDYFEVISAVVEALAKDMVKNEYGLLKPGTKYNKSKKKQQPDNDGFRLNLDDMSFKLYENAVVVDARATRGEHHIPLYHVVETTFKNYSPFIKGLKVAETDCCEEVSEKGKAAISERVDRLRLDSPLLIQAEHTAQVEKGVAKKLQNDFKDHLVNIMACSTTMEMGVDLGDLELVMLGSVPPMPANYKQRAGRSGRNMKVKSACVTLCGSDAIGLRTLGSPLETIIQRAVNMPTVDLKSPQIIQRHINSFLVRSFGVFKKGKHGGKLSMSVMDYYTTFHLERDGKEKKLVYENGDPVKIGFEDEDTGEGYLTFENKCVPEQVKLIAHDLARLLKSTCFDGVSPMKVVKVAQASNQDCMIWLKDRIEELRSAFLESDNEKYKNFLRVKFRILLTQRLLDFWASRRFIPNANMPVNVVDFDLVNSSDYSYAPGGESNPSYTMSQALTQYAPGRKVVVDGVAHTVGGVLSTNSFKKENAYTTIYHDNTRTTLDFSEGLGKIIPWPVNNQNGLKLVQPVSFLPDKETDCSRDLSEGAYAIVESQLVGTQNWDDESHDPHLFQVKTNRENPDGRILFYIQGSGFGYCYCPYCGHAVQENVAAKADTPLPKDFNPNPVVKKIEGEDKIVYRHTALSGKRYGTVCDCPKSKVQRNVIIGDLMATDFAEIRFRLFKDKKWLSAPDNLTLTLAIVITAAFAEYEGINRDAVGFATMHNGHVVIFDTNPGGAGYSLKLSDTSTMVEVLLIARKNILAARMANSVDMLLDKYTLRFLPKMDVPAALEWIEKELDSRDCLPDEVTEVYPSAIMSGWRDLESAIAETTGKVDIFFSPIKKSENLSEDFREWDYDDSDMSWSNFFREIFIPVSGNLNAHIFTENGNTIPDGAKQMLAKLGGWTASVDSAKACINIGKLRPIAIVNGYIYFTNDQLMAQLNSSWSSGTLYKAKADVEVCSYSDLSINASPDTMLFKLDSTDNENIESTLLAGLIHNKATHQINEFIESAKLSGATLELTYQDKHLKSRLGVLLVLGVMAYFIKQIKRPFSVRFLLEEFYGESRGKSIVGNMSSNQERDDFLKEKLRDLLYFFGTECDLSGTAEEKVTYSKGILPHWRELTMRCGEKTLRIMPDGGFMNGWKLDDKPYLWNNRLDEISFLTSFPLRRTDIIQFVVKLEDN